MEDYTPTRIKSFAIAAKLTSSLGSARQTSRITPMVRCPPFSSDSIVGNYRKLVAPMPAVRRSTRKCCGERRRSEVGFCELPVMLRVGCKYVQRLGLCRLADRRTSSAFSTKHQSLRSSAGWV